MAYVQPDMSEYLGNESVTRIAAVQEHNTARSQGLSDHTGVPGSRDIGAGRRASGVPVNPEQSHASGVGQSHQKVIQVAFVDRKYFHSINVEIICDVLTQLTNVVRGGLVQSHDSFILTNSLVRNTLGAGTVPDGWVNSLVV